MFHRTIVLTALASVVCACTAGTIYAVPASPLQDAYWRFEEGTAGNPVPLGNDTVLDSINANHMQTANAGTAPLYTSAVSTGIVPQTGAANTLALQFSGAQDIFTRGGEGGQAINHPITTAFTLEAAFMPTALDRFQAIVGKDGKPTDSPLQTLVLKMRGDTNELQIEMYDAGGTIRGIRSQAALMADQWYYAAVVNDGSSMSLYLDSNDGSGYVLQGTELVNGALFQNETSWSIGRGMFNNNPADWFIGLIDEVRLSNTALSPDQFLFVPEPASLMLLGIGGLWVLRRRHGRRR
jgi:hypothetical protein